MKRPLLPQVAAALLLFWAGALPAAEAPTSPTHTDYQILKIGTGENFWLAPGKDQVFFGRDSAPDRLIVDRFNRATSTGLPSNAPQWAFVNPVSHDTLVVDPLDVYLTQPTPDNKYHTQKLAINTPGRGMRDTLIRIPPIRSGDRIWMHGSDGVLRTLSTTSPFQMSTAPRAAPWVVRTLWAHPQSSRILLRTSDQGVVMTDINLTPYNDGKSLIGDDWSLTRDHSSVPGSRSDVVWFFASHRSAFIYTILVLLPDGKIIDVRNLLGLEPSTRLDPVIHRGSNGAYGPTDIVWAKETDTEIPYVVSAAGGNVTAKGLSQPTRVKAISVSQTGAVAWMATADGGILRAELLANGTVAEQRFAKVWSPEDSTLPPQVQASADGMTLWGTTRPSDPTQATVFHLTAAHGIQTWPLPLGFGQGSLDDSLVTNASGSAALVSHRSETFTRAFLLVDASRGILNSASPLVIPWINTHGPVEIQPQVSVQDENFWIFSPENSSGALHFLSAQSTITGMSLKIGSDTLSYPASGPGDLKTTLGQRASIKLQSGAVTAGAPAADGRIVLRALPRDKLKSGIEIPVDRGAETILPDTLKLNEPYLAELVYNDDLGRHFAAHLPTVVFVAPWLDRSKVHAALLALIVLFVAGGLILLAAHFPKMIITWLPALWMAGCALAGSIPSSELWGKVGVEGGFLTLCLTTASAGLTLAFFFIPRPFIFLAQIEPYASLMRLALASPGFRARLLRDYVSKLQASLDRERTDAMQERYYPLPAKHGASTVPEPAKAILQALRKSQQPTCIMIRGFGGVGKSALLRESIRNVLATWQHDKQMPLPHYLENSESPESRRNQQILRETSGGKKIIEQLGRMGLIFHVRDGLLGAPAPERQDADASSPPLQVSELIASRPTEALEDYLRSSPLPHLVLEPQALDNDAMLDRFVLHYTPGHKTVGFGPELRAACRDKRRLTYSPIFVRLAIKHGQGARSVADIYFQALTDLLTKQDKTTFNATAALGLKRQLEKETTQFAYRLARPEEKEILQKLLKAGIVVPVSLAEKTEPAAVQFFHDSLLAYLAAVGLNQQEPRLWPSRLLEIAGHPRFLESEENSPVKRSEFFEMCVSVISPSEPLRTFLLQQLRAWADSPEITERITLHQVKVSPPPEIRSQWSQRVSASPNSHQALSALIDVCQHADKDIDEPPYHLGFAYAIVAPIVWAQQQEAKAKALQSSSSEPKPSAPSAPAPSGTLS